MISYRASSFFAVGSSSTLSPSALGEEIARLSRELLQNGREGTIVAVSLGRMINSISERLPPRINSRLFQDCYRIVSSMASPFGKCFSFGERALLLCIDNGGSFDMQLFLLQLQKSMKRFLPAWCDAQLVLLYSGPMPEDVSELASVLPTLSTE